MRPNHRRLILAVAACQQAAASGGASAVTLQGRVADLACSWGSPDEVLVSWEGGEVAALAVSDGSVRWRTRPSLSQDRAAPAVLVEGSREAWEADLRTWLWSAHRAPSTVVALPLAAAGTRNYILGFPNVLEAIVWGGSVLWRYPVEELVAAAVSKDGSQVCVLDLKRTAPSSGSGASASIHVLEVGTGRLLAARDVNQTVAQALSAGRYVSSGDHVVLLPEDGEMLLAQPLCGEGPLGFFNLQVLRTRPPKPVRLLPWRRTEGVFAATNDAFTFLFRLGGPTGLQVLRVENAVGAVGPVCQSGQSGSPADGEAPAAGAVAKALHRKEGHQLQLVNATSGSVGPAQVLAVSAEEDGPPELVLALESSDAVFVRATKGSLRLIATSADQILWRFPIGGSEGKAASSEL